MVKSSFQVCCVQANPRARFRGALADINATAARFKAAMACKDVHHRFSPRLRPGTMQGPNTSTPFVYNTKRGGLMDIYNLQSMTKTPGCLIIVQLNIFAIISN